MRTLNYRLFPFIYSLERNGGTFWDIILFLEYISNPLIFFILYSVFLGWVSVTDGASLVIRFFLILFVFLSIYEIWYYFNDAYESREKTKKKSTSILRDTSGIGFVGTRVAIFLFASITLIQSYYLLPWILAGILSLVVFHFHNIIRNTLANFFTFFFLRIVKILPMLLIFWELFPSAIQSVVFICLFPFTLAVIGYSLPKLIHIADSDSENYSFFQLLLSIAFSLIVIIYGIWFGIVWVWAYGLLLFLRQIVWYTARKAWRAYWKFSRIQ